MEGNAHLLSTYDAKLWVAKSDTVFPPALHQRYIYGAKFEDRIRLLVDDGQF